MSATIIVPRVHCWHCGQELPAVRKEHQKFCSRRCKEQAHKKRLYEERKAGK